MKTGANVRKTDSAAVDSA